MTSIELEAVRKEYGTTIALNDVSVRIDDGEFFTLVGPSGCGKTTTLRLIAGFESPTAGTIRFDGDDVSGFPPETRGVGVVFQSYALFPHMSVGENVAYGLHFSDPPDGRTREERVTELLDLVDLPGMADRDPETLSGGQQQRVALARALAPGPRVLLLDEPMSALDAQLRERLRLQVKRIQSVLGVTTVYVTHDQAEALSISDRVAVMNGGSIEQVGTPRDVYRRPASPFVARFVGDNNVFSGRVDSVESVADGADRITVLVEGTAFAIEPAAVSRSVRPGDDVTFCVRPEWLRVADSAGDTDGELKESNAIEATVTGAEFLGDTTRVHLEWNSSELTLRTTDPVSGTVRVSFDPSDAHLVAARSN
ncbi:MAG: ABC transporter ATP-binding protein [Halobacteriota archaeon]